MDNCALGFYDTILGYFKSYLKKITKISIWFVKKGRKVFDDLIAIINKITGV